MIVIKTPEEIEKMANACCIVAEILKDMKAFVKPGVSTKEMEMFAEEKIISRGFFKNLKVIQPVLQKKRRIDWQVERISVRCKHPKHASRFDGRVRGSIN